MSHFSTILFARPSFLEGVARIFDFSGILSTYNTSRYPAEADARAVRADWQAVGDDLWEAFAQADAEYKAARNHAAHE